MARNRARFYIELLLKKGWSDDDIQSFCNIASPRLEYLKMMRAIPKNLEVQRLKGMMKKTTPEAMEVVLDAWRGQSRSPILPEPTHLDDLTDKQKDVLKLMGHSVEKGHPSCILGAVEASVATRLSKRGLVNVDKLKTKSGVVKRYSLTNNGLATARVLGFVSGGVAVPTLPVAGRRAPSQPSQS